MFDNIDFPTDDDMMRLDIRLHCLPPIIWWGVRGRHDLLQFCWRCVCS